MKKLGLLICFITVFIVLGLIWYFASPLKIQHVMRHTNNIEKIDFTISSQGEMHQYSMQFHEESKISEMLNFLDSETYNRELKTYKGSTDEVIFMIIFYRNRDGALDNYSFDMNESGVIISDKKQYQMRGDTKKVFNSLYEWIKTEGLSIRN
ncbi:hypothetical protein [Paenibacillus sp. R14(2021)]|uniref:hypothetical protein n=1 Tax=Paenibacillus sp. R14(2021) TaxID=2859228 RepID=UPI001C6124C7|nr:hypothetical protein [Paenibacillus sp. R14(2021)]